MTGERYPGTRFTLKLEDRESLDKVHAPTKPDIQIPRESR